MSTLTIPKPAIQKAEDLPTILFTHLQWNSIKECRRSVFRSLDIGLVAERRVTLLDAMESKVTDIIADALDKGILIKQPDGSVVIASARNS